MDYNNEDDDQEKLLMEMYGLAEGFGFDPPVAEVAPTEKFLPDFESSEKSSLDSSPIIAEIILRFGLNVDKARQFKKRIWEDGKEKASKAELISTYSGFLTDYCIHDYKEVRGLFKSWYNCKKCGIGKEEI